MIEANLDLVLGNDITSPVAINEMKKMNEQSVFDKEKMHKSEHRQGYEKPKLVSAIGDRGVQVEEVKKQIVVKKGGKVIAYTLAFGIAKKKVENDVEAKADYKIPKRSFKEALCLFETKGVVAVVVEIAADHKKCGHGESVKGEVGVCFSRKVNAYHEKGQKHLEQIKRETSFWNRHGKAPFCIFLKSIQYSRILKKVKSKRAKEQIELTEGRKCDILNLL